MRRRLVGRRGHVQQDLNRPVDITDPVVGDHSEIDRVQPVLQFLSPIHNWTFRPQHGHFAVNEFTQERIERNGKRRNRSDLLLGRLRQPFDTGQRSQILQTSPIDRVPLPPNARVAQIGLEDKYRGRSTTCLSTARR